MATNLQPPQPPLPEAPITVGFLQPQDHYDYDKSNTSVAERRPLFKEEVWIDMSAIPVVPPSKSPFPGTSLGSVSGISGVLLASVPGSGGFQFQAAVAGQLANVVPGNYNAGAYQPTLKDATGKIIPYFPGTWVVDGILQIVQFNDKTPQALGYTLPLTIDFWPILAHFHPQEAAAVFRELPTSEAALARSTRPR